MPELPEVESARCLVEAHCIGAKVTKVEFNEDGSFDEKIFKDVERKAFVSALLNKTLKAAHRRGKHMWWDMSGGADSPLFHFGMTGAFSIRGKGAMKYKAFVVDTSNWPPRFAKLVVTFDNGIALAYTDPRRFGRIRLVHGDVTASPPISELGFDPLLAMPDETTFASHFAKRGGPIKSVLLDQTIAAGVGNWIADEVLYHSRLHPEQPAKSLTPAQLRDLRDAMEGVIKTACDAGADAEMFPDDWLFHHRWGKVAGEVGDEPIQFITVGGRTTAFVPKRQKKTSEKPAAGVKAEPKKRGAENDEPSKAPAKKAAVKRAPAKKVVARKAPAKKPPPRKPMAVAATRSLRARV